MKTHQQIPRQENELEQVKRVLNKLLKAQENGDTNSFMECFAHDSYMINIGTDIDEIWKTWDEFYNYMDNALDQNRGANISTMDTNIKISQDKKVAWYSQLVDTCLETKGDHHRLEGFRHTGVMEKRQNKWVIVQSHISIPYKPPVELEEMV